MSQALRDQKGGESFDRELKRAAGFIAGMFAMEGKQEFATRQLPRTLAAWDRSFPLSYPTPTRLSEPDIADEVVSVLKRKDFLTPRPLSRERIAMEGDVVQLDILPFWQYLGGNRLANRIVQESHDQAMIEEIFKSRLAPYATRPLSASIAGLMEFTILWLDHMAVGDKLKERSREAAGACAQHLARLVITEMKGVRSNVWLAAAKASPSFQRRLCHWLENEATVFFEEREDFHRFMYFAKNARLQVSRTDLPPHLRFKLLQPHYEQVGEMRLVGYFEKLIDYILVDWVGGAEIARSIAYLYGTESFWDAEHWGGWAYRKLKCLAQSKGSADWDTLVSWMLIIRDEVSRILTTARKQSSMAASQSDERIHERDRLWAWVMGHFCEDIKDDKKLGSLEWLSERGWFPWSDHGEEVSRRVLNAMEEQFTTVLGRWYRSSASLEEKGSYIDEAEHLRQSDGLRRITAIFLIYHTVAKDSGHKLDDDRLWELLDELRWDDDPDVKRLWRNVGSLRDFYEHQAGFFQQCEAEPQRS